MTLLDKILPRKKFIVDLNYKSGKTITIAVYELKTKRNHNAELISINYILVNPEMSLIHVGINDIESIVQKKISRWF